YDQRGKREYLDKARTAVEKGQDLIERMRDMDGLISGGSLGPVDMREVAEGGLSGLTVHHTVEGEGRALADDSVYSLFDNIVHNAVIHGQTPEIRVVLQESGNRCVVRIEDQGKGIPEEIKNRVFEEGFTHGKSGQHGLGLYIVKKTMERYGGEVRIEDNSPRGSVFVLEFPRA
ncbi:MAG: sensor histidine kinase, partial [Methanomassiliicoccales archaeon]